jgi:hypothetical protein
LTSEQRAAEKDPKSHIYHINRNPKIAKKIPNYEAVVERISKEARKEIESESRRLSKLQYNIPSPNRELGTQDWSDVPTNMPFQKLVLDQLGKTMRPNAPYICPHCGMKHMGMPSAFCGCCKKPTVFAQLNLRR